MGFPITTVSFPPSSPVYVRMFPSWCMDAGLELRVKSDVRASAFVMGAFPLIIVSITLPSFPPCWVMYSTTSLWQFSLARSNGVIPAGVNRLIFIPLSTKNWTTERCPFIAAMWSAHPPPLHSRVTSAPCSTRNSTVSTFPADDAMYNGVCPSSFTPSMSEWCWRMNSTHSVSPLRAAMKSGVRPFLSFWLISPLCEWRNSITFTWPFADAMNKGVLPISSTQFTSPPLRICFSARFTSPIHAAKCNKDSPWSKSGVRSTSCSARNSTTRMCFWDKLLERVDSEFESIFAPCWRRHSRMGTDPTSSASWTEVSFSPGRDNKLPPPCERMKCTASNLSALMAWVSDILGPSTAPWRLSISTIAGLVVISKAVFPSGERRLILSSGLFKSNETISAWPFWHAYIRPLKLVAGSLLNGCCAWFVSLMFISRLLLNNWESSCEFQFPVLQKEKKRVLSPTMEEEVSSTLTTSTIDASFFEPTCDEQAPAICEWMNRGKEEMHGWMEMNRQTQKLNCVASFWISTVLNSSSSE